MAAQKKEIPIECTNGRLFLRLDSGEVDFEPSGTVEDGPLYYDPAARAPTWEMMIWEILAVNDKPESMFRHLHEMLGWLIWKTTVKNMHWIWTGHARSGKIEILNAVKPLLQRDKAKSVRLYGELPKRAGRYRDEALTMFFPFSRVFTEQEELSSIVTWERIATHELSGVLNLAIDGAVRLIKRGHFAPPPECIAVKSKWLRAKSEIDIFLDECCVVSPSAVDGEQSSKIYRAYQHWRKHRKNIGDIGRNTFYRQLTERGYATRATGNNVRRTKGVWLKADFWESV